MSKFDIHESLKELSRKKDLSTLHSFSLTVLLVVPDALRVSPGPRRSARGHRSGGREVGALFLVISQFTPKLTPNSGILSNLSTLMMI